MEISYKDKIKAPVKQNSKFMFWSEDNPAEISIEECRKFNFDKTPIVKNVTLYPVYRPVNTVTFKMTPGPDETMQVVHGQTAKDPQKIYDSDIVVTEGETTTP